MGGSGIRWPSAVIPATIGRDCKQVCIALVVSKHGIPLGYEVFAGNRSDVTTLPEIVDSYGAALRPGGKDLGRGSGHGFGGKPGLSA